VNEDKDRAGDEEVEVYGRADWVRSEAGGYGPRSFPVAKSGSPPNGPDQYDQAELENLVVGDERHSHTPLCRNSAGLERKRAEFHNCADAG
jgi:hypothetical protein